MTDNETTWILETLRQWLRGATEPGVCPVELSPERLADRLERNRLLPLFQHLPVAFPMIAEWGPFRARKECAYQRNLLQALQQLQSGTQLLEHLEQAGIPSLAIRGPFLALDVYGDPAARMSTDIDILVRRRDRRRAWECCRPMGYRSLEWECPVWPVDAHRIHWRLQRAGDPTVCELHWTLEPVYGVMTLRYDGLFEQGYQRKESGFAWRQPCPDHMLLLLCRHTGRHLADAQQAQSIAVRSGAEAFDQGVLFRWLDVALFLRRYGAQVNWGWIAEQTADRRVGQSLVVSLEGVRDWLGVRLPQEAERYLPLWADAAETQRSSNARRRVEMWWERQAGPACGLETPLADVLYFLCPHALFFAPARGVGLCLRRTGHSVVAALKLLGAFLCYCGFVALTAARRVCRRQRAPLPSGHMIPAGGQP